MNEFDVGIVGGGVTGLTSAYTLSKKGYRVILFEKAEQLGGQLSSVKHGGYWIEDFYHHLILTDQTSTDLVRELGLSGSLSWDLAHTAFMDEKGTYRFSTPFDLLSYKPLSILDKIKLGVLLLKIRSIRNPKKYDNISVKDWIKKNSSVNVYEKFFKPMLQAKFGSKTDSISTAWFIERITLRSHRGSRGETLGYLKGGFHRLIKRLHTEAEKHCCVVITSSSVERIITRKNLATEIKTKTETYRVKAVISTIPTHNLVEIVDLSDHEKEQFTKIQYQGVICILLALKKKITEYYWTNILRCDVEIGAVIEHTNFQPVSDYGDNLAYLAIYPASDSSVWSMSDKDIYAQYLAELARIFPRFSIDDVDWYNVNKTGESNIIYDIGIRDRIPDVRTSIGNLFIGGVFNSYPERGIGTSIQLGLKCARCIEDFLGEPATNDD